MDEDCIRLTREILQSEADPLFKKPRLTDALLRRPPFRFLHDIISAVQRKTGFASGLFSNAESNAKTVNREAKMTYLKKLIDLLDVEADPAKIVAGMEPERTNALLQALGRAARLERDDNPKLPSNRPPSRRHPSERTHKPAGEETISKVQGETQLKTTALSLLEDDSVVQASTAPLGDVRSRSRRSSEHQGHTSTDNAPRVSLEDSRREQGMPLDLDLSPSMSVRPQSRRHPSERTSDAFDVEDVPFMDHSAVPSADVLKREDAEDMASGDDAASIDIRPPSRGRATAKSTGERDMRVPTVDVLCLDATRTDPSNDALCFEMYPSGQQPDNGVIENGKREVRLEEGPQVLSLESPSSRCSSRPQTARKAPPSRRPVSSRGRSSRPIPTPFESSSESEQELETDDWLMASKPECEGALVRDLKREVAEECVPSNRATELKTANLRSIGEMLHRLMSLLDGLRRCLEHLSNASTAAEKERGFWRRETDICLQKLNEHTTTAETAEVGYLRDLDEDIRQTQSRIRLLKDANNFRDLEIKQMLKSLTE